MAAPPEDAATAIREFAHALKTAEGQEEATEESWSPSQLWQTALGPPGRREHSPALLDESGVPVSREAGAALLQCLTGLPALPADGLHSRVSGKLGHGLDCWLAGAHLQAGFWGGGKVTWPPREHATPPPRPIGAESNQPVLHLSGRFVEQFSRLSSPELSRLRQLVWSGQNVPEAWLQGFEFSTERWRFGLRQRQQGPCAMLAAVQACMLSLAGLERWVMDPPNQHTLDNALAVALSTCVTLSSSGCCRMVSWDGQESTVPSVTTVDLAATLGWVQSNLWRFKGPAGCVMLLYSVLLTRGLGQVEQDLQSDFNAAGKLEDCRNFTGQRPYKLSPALVYKGLGTSTLISLLLCGVAARNVGFWSALSKQEFEFPEMIGVGMLTTLEFYDRQQLPINKTLKSPRLPIWVLHDQDHFSVLFRPTQPNEGEAELMAHWDGLTENLLKFSVTSYADGDDTDDSDDFDMDDSDGLQVPRLALYTRAGTHPRLAYI